MTRSAELQFWRRRVLIWSVVERSQTLHQTLNESVGQNGDVSFFSCSPPIWSSVFLCFSVNKATVRQTVAPVSLHCSFPELFHIFVRHRVYMWRTMNCQMFWAWIYINMCIFQIHALISIVKTPQINVLTLFPQYWAFTWVSDME